MTPPDSTGSCGSPCGCASTRSSATSEAADSDRRSAIIVAVELPKALARVRQADRMAGLGVPPHVTILFPFVPAGSVGDGLRSALGEVAGARQAFVARFERAERTTDSIWLVPEPQEAFLQLTDDVVARWPAHRPYGGAHDGNLIAHLTLVETTEPGALDLGALAATAAVPFEAPVTELTVITEDDGGRWHEQWRVRLGAHLASGRRR